MKYISILKYLILIPITLLSFTVNSAEKTEIEGISIIGNKETPNLLYIVPWKSPSPPELADPTLSSTMLNKSLESVERGDMIKKDVYHEKIQAKKK